MRFGLFMMPLHPPHRSFADSYRRDVDQIVLATGYRVNVARVPFLANPSLTSALRVEGGFPVLDEAFQASIPGLFMTGILATKDFGPFYGFVRGCPTAARLIVDRITDRRPA